MTVRRFQALIEETFGAKDRGRGLAGTFMWFAEEVGELARALKKKAPDHANLEEEFADVFAWLATLASIAGVDLAEAAAKKYGAGCPRCGAAPCACAEASRFKA
ncbi:MAG TPA: MazG nucleotide pyrophosphohydrolase domain-containing protein [Planctomycetota bacterium]|nr:MazG nucleotide pyrophosphohydrolase domain-containing protein [Planctomycetota bacterium]